MIWKAYPGIKGFWVVCPAGRSSSNTFSRTGFWRPAPRVSWDRTANPSMAELSKGGISRSETISSAKVMPRESNNLTSTDSRR